MAAIVGVAFEVSERMLKTSPHDPKAAADFATALFLGGVRALPEMQHHETSESTGELKSDAA